MQQRRVFPAFVACSTMLQAALAKGRCAGGETALKKYRVWFAIACAATATSVSWAQTVTPTQALAFGSFAAGTGGTVTISAAGARSQSGGVILVSSGSGSAALFSVSGTPNATYSISLPANGVVSMTSGVNSMAVNDFTSSPNLTGALSGGGAQTLSVGAMLGVGSNQASGSYNGGFDVTVNYN